MESAAIGRWLLTSLEAATTGDQDPAAKPHHGRESTSQPSHNVSPRGIVCSSSSLIVPLSSSHSSASCPCPCPSVSALLPFHRGTSPPLPAPAARDLLLLTHTMSRRYPTAELYEERERDFYRSGNRSERNYEELDIELRRGGGGDPRRSVPDFLHDDYNRPNTAGQMVIRSRDDEFTRGPRSSATFDDSRSVRSARPPPPPSSVRGRDDINIRHSDAPGRSRAREVETDETDITIRRREQSRPRQPEFREVEREDIVFRRGDGPPSSRPPQRESERDEVRFRGRGGGDGIDFHASRSEVSRNGRDVSAERGSIRFQERDGNFEIRANRREFSRDGRDTSRERSSLTIRGRERSLPPPARNRGDLVAREREEFVIRRPREQSPPTNSREIIRDEIIIRRKEERAPTPSPSPSPPPPPPPPAPEPEIRPPIIQEIITHHRHIDHGMALTLE